MKKVQKVVNTRQASTKDLKAFLKDSGQYNPGETRKAMVEQVNALLIAKPDKDKISSPDLTQVHRVRRAGLAWERKHRKELDKEGFLSIIRPTFPDFSDTGFQIAVKEILV